MPPPDLALLLRSPGLPPLRDRLRLVAALSLPAVLAQLTSIAMEYIDAAMVGNLGANASASIGLVATSTWLVYGLGNAIGSGISVQVAQAVGARDDARTRRLVAGGYRLVLLASLLLGAVATAIAFPLPRWLGADPAIRPDATRYFLLFGLAQPIVMATYFTLGLLQSSGDMRRPAILSALMCLLDVLFNALCIFPARTLRPAWLPFPVPLPGLGLGVTGAALGTLLATLAVCLLALDEALRRSPVLRIRPGAARRLLPDDRRLARRISVPMALESAALTGANILITAIIAPLGAVALAANAFGVTAEALCYMPAFGFGAAATTIVGQAIGANRPATARAFAWLTVWTGAAAVTLVAGLMFLAAPLLFRFFTPDETVRALGVHILRIEVLCEPLFAASIIANGALRGAGDTFVPALINLCCMWGFRLTLAWALARRYGLAGVWIAMCLELCLRGLLYLLRLARQPFLPLR